ncbi:MAG: glycan-binding surface protein [Prevotella sp.]|jgi:hypothetical protein|nr:glycan-binding surface protein [Prevotella sp.]
MKNIIYKNFWTSLLLAGIFVFALMSLNSCKDDDNENGGNNKQMLITKVYLEDAQSSVPDREVTFGRIGQLLRLEGSGFAGVQKVYINGYNVMFNPVYVTDNNILVQIPRGTPTMDAADDVRNTIIMEKGSIRYIYSFDIRDAAPSITSISHTMPVAGDVITIYGSGLQGVTSVVFPGDVTVTTGIVSDDEDGKFCTVTVPAGVSNDGGAIKIISANGGAYSPSYFNFKKGLIQNFDDVNNYSWASNMDGSAVLSSVIPTSGDGPKSQNNYQCFNTDGKTIATNGDVRYWTNSADWPSALLSVIPAGTSTSNCGVQMDIYVEGVWNSGVIRMVMADGSGTERYCMIYRPWYKDAAVVPFENPGCWFTITLPFSDSSDYEGKTFDDVVSSMVKASYKQAGPWFHNIGVPGASGQPAIVEPEATTVKIYFDNIRVVPLDTPVYDEFGNG